MNKQKETFEKVSAFLKANPGTSIADACKELHVSAVSYYKGRTQVSKAEKPAKRPYNRKVPVVIKAEEPLYFQPTTKTPNVMVLIGDSTTIARMIGL